MNSDKQSFDKNFEIFIADTEAGKSLNFQIRYQVFCEEMGFADQELYPEQMEFDAWDLYADHFLVRDRYTGEWIGAMRLVYPIQARLPFQENLLLATNDDATTQENLSDAVELSRFCVLKEMRRFGLPKFKVQVSPNSNLFQGNPQITHLQDLRINKRMIMWGLYRAAAIYLEKKHISHIYTLLTGALYSQIQREGIALQKIETSGEQQAGILPYQLSIKNILDNKNWEHDYKQEFRLYSATIKETDLKQKVS